MVAPAPVVTREHLALAAAYRRRQRETATARRAEIEADWRTWLLALFPTWTKHEFADFHAEFWAWVWAIKPGRTAPPFVAIWPRGWAKSTSAELACALIAATNRRSYGLVVSETQDQADKRVQNIAALLESPQFAAVYPRAASRKVGKYGASKGWRRDRLWTANGVTFDALGLDTAVRGVKVEDERPDFIVCDDLDGKLDTPATTEKKIAILTHSVIPAGSEDAAVLMIQNLVLPNGVFAQLADGRADFLSDRVVSGPHPAIRNLVTERTPDGKTRIVSGEPSWPAMGLGACQEIVNKEGITAFLAERQHEVEAPPGGMFDQVVFRRCRWDEIPDLVDIIVAIDPAVTDTDQSDSHAIQADGIAADGNRQGATIYRLYSWEQRTSPEDAMRRALRKAVELGASTVLVETNQGGDTWKSVYEQAWQALVNDPDVPEITAVTRRPAFEQVKAPSTTTKVSRASQMLADYERGQMVHVIGTHEVLEKGLRRFPKTKPLDLVDAAGWARKKLRSGAAAVAAAGIAQRSTWGTP